STSSSVRVVCVRICFGAHAPTEVGSAELRTHFNGELPTRAAAQGGCPISSRRVPENHSIKQPSGQVGATEQQIELRASELNTSVKLSNAGAPGLAFFETWDSSLQGSSFSVDRNTPGHQLPAVAVPIAQRDAKQSWRSQRAVSTYDGERYRLPVVGAATRESHGMCNVVERRGGELRGLEVNARARIAERRAVRPLTGIVIVEVEMGVAAVLAVFVAIAAGFVTGTRTFALGSNGRGLLSREVRDRRAGMIVRIGNVDTVARIHTDLEKVGQAAVGAAQQASSRDLTRMVGVVGGLAEREYRRDSMAIHG